MLGNFTYANPTRLHFGEESLLKLNEELTQYGKNVLLIYGGGSIKTFGIYDKIIAILNKQQKQITEIADVLPNPTLEKLLEGCHIAKTNDIDLILAVGGGSVIDFAKAVSVSTYCEDDVWEKYFVRMEDVDHKIIPVGSVVTMVGTGSEMNGGTVITNQESKMKVGHVFDERVFPKFSILNPVFTYSIPYQHMVAGFFDIMSHILEQYFSGYDDSTSDYIMEGLLRSLLHSTRIAIKDPCNYEARSNIMWISTWALNTLVAKGKPTDWMVHMMGQAIGGHTNATHGMTLSAISIPYYQMIYPYGMAKFKRFAIHVWDVSPTGKTDDEIITEGLSAMVSYMEELGLVMHLAQLGVQEKMIEDIAFDTLQMSGGYMHLTNDDIQTILKRSM